MNSPSPTTEHKHHFPVATQKVVIGMSGGVDSSVAAYLLKHQGYDVCGIFMHNWRETNPEFPCTATEDAHDALEVCDSLGIELDAIDFSSEYWQRVFAYFLDEYRRGRTPNPDVLCNKEIKFNAFLDHALAQGADCIATGHYARIQETDGCYRLLKARDPGKDQSYFLYTLGQAQLARSLFPVGGLHKSEVRRIAREQGFANAAKKDSTGICFIGERDFNKFLSHYLPAQPGEIRTADGRHLGSHDGLMYYTLGQRKGIGIGGRKGMDESPWYVVDKDMANNILVVAQGHDHPLLYHRGLRAGAVHWVAGEPPAIPLRCRAKTRYRQTERDCVVSRDGSDAYLVHFDEAQRAVTPGQSVVFYQGEVCLGGGIIEKIVS
ncbi:MAG: tRNA 2-thiouridine(34) synthase MnmA [Gammaproteobacteria bacterium]|jgi:tRNA-specific 2-thiouridylase